MESLKRIPHIEEFKDELHGIFDESRVNKSYLTRAEQETKRSKVVPSLEEAIRLSGLKDGMTISFHHHFRNGDYVVNMVMDTIARMGIKHLTLDDAG